MDRTETLKFVKVRNVKSPSRGTEFSAGLDFYVPEDFNNGTTYYLQPQHDVLIKSGIRALLPHGVMLMGADKSGIATSRNAMIEAGNTPKPGNPMSSLKIGAKIIDEDYQGEIGLHIINVGNAEAKIEPGQKITQFIMVPVIYCDLVEYPHPDLLFTETTERGEDGFGSTSV